MDGGSRRHQTPSEYETGTLRNSQSKEAFMREAESVKNMDHLGKGGMRGQMVRRDSNRSSQKSSLINY
jgi:hypothetical protein